MPNPFSKFSSLEIPQHCGHGNGVYGGVGGVLERFGTTCPDNDSQLALSTEGQHLEECGHRNISVKGCRSPAEKKL